MLERPPRLETCDTRNQPFSHLHRQVWHLSSYSRSEEDILACSIIFHFWLWLSYMFVWCCCQMYTSSFWVTSNCCNSRLLKWTFWVLVGGMRGKWLFQKIANHHLKWLVSHCVASKIWCNCQLLEVKRAHLKFQTWICMSLLQLLSLAWHFCQFGCEYNGYNV